MGWPLTHVAEIARRRHDSGAEVILPEPIYQYARRERIVRRDKPAGQRQAALLLWRISRQLVAFRGVCERAQAGRRDLRALPLGVSSLEYMLPLVALFEVAHMH